MTQLDRFILHPMTGKIFLSLLAGTYIVYLVAFGHGLSLTLFGPHETIIEQSVNTSPELAVKYWTTASMQSASDADQKISTTSDLTQTSIDISQGKAVQQEGQPPHNGNNSYPLSTIGKVFLTNAAGQNLACSGTAVASSNGSVVDTAGHCLYLNGGWMRNVIFCPQYENGNTPYGCWAARDLEVPSDWINARPNDHHHDFGMMIVAPNNEEVLTDVVGGAGWAYNQPANQTFYAYGYPAASPFDGQTRKSCEGATGTSWQHGSGNVVSIPCGMTGGSSGGPWFIQINGKLYLNGHNDFTNSLQPGYMFSPYYDDTWFTLYDKAQQT
ncbi:MAG: trypsin-like serine peptidase [Ktedonobacteraceae bacterium]